MKFHLRTGFGDSDSSYSSTNVDEPYQGLCQGNGAASGVFGIISAFVINYMKSQGHSMEIISAISSQLLDYITLMFVDDGDFPTYARSARESIKSVAKRHQKTVQCWSSGLSVSGGALKAAKCFWYPINWEWKKGIATPQAIKHIKAKIKVTDPDGKSNTVKKLDYKTTRKVMGITGSLSTPTPGRNGVT